MIFSFQDIVSHYSKKRYPCINQADLIANKYKELFGTEIQPTQELYLLVNVSSTFRPTDRYLKITNSTEANIEKQAFARRMNQLKKLKSFLKELGIDKKSYMLIYDYENIVISQNPKKKDELAVNFQFPSVYLVLFEKEHYNFVRLVYEYKEQKNPVDYIELLFDFTLGVISEGYNF